jgi:hypothetical protein
MYSFKCYSRRYTQSPLNFKQIIKSFTHSVPTEYYFATYRSLRMEREVILGIYFSNIYTAGLAKISPLRPSDSCKYHPV